MLSRKVKAGRIVSISRRTVLRLLLFQPNDPRVKQMFEYLLAVIAKRYSMKVHAWYLFGNHYHLVLTDVLGVLPDFLHDFHENLALRIMKIRDFPEAPWNKSQTSTVDILTVDAEVDQITYVMAQSSAGFATRYAEDWPGAMSHPSDIGKTLRFKRPKGLFPSDDEEKWPEEIEMKVELPERLAAAYGNKSVEVIVQQLREKERAAWDEAEAKGIPFAGLKRVLKRSHADRATSHEDRGGRNPKFAAGNDKEAAAAWLAEEQRFQDDYRWEWELGVSGHWDLVVFPHGTWKMHQVYGFPARGP